MSSKAAACELRLAVLTSSCFSSLSSAMSRFAHPLNFLMGLQMETFKDAGQDVPLHTSLDSFYRASWGPRRRACKSCTDSDAGYLKECVCTQKAIFCSLHPARLHIDAGPPRERTCTREAMSGCNRRTKGMLPYRGQHSDQMQTQRWIHMQIRDLDTQMLGVLYAQSWFQALASWLMHATGNTKQQQRPCE